MTCKKLSEVGDVITHSFLAGEWVVVSVCNKSENTQVMVLMKLVEGNIVDWKTPQLNEYQALKVDTLFNDHTTVRNLIKEKQ